MKILKFGGTSVGSPDAIKKVMDIILESRKTTPEILVVVSNQLFTNQFRFLPN